MDRFEYTDPQMRPGENIVYRDESVRLYDGENKTTYKDGELAVTNVRILWGRSGDIQRGTTCLGLQLLYVVFVEEEQRTFSLGSNRKFVLHLSQTRPGKVQGPVAWSQHSHVKLSFKEGTRGEFLSILRDALVTKAWERSVATSNVQSPSSSTGQIDRRFRAGIVGIERGINERQRATDESISIAFQDLSRLMEMAKDMVAISRSISNKIRKRICILGNIRCRPRMNLDLKAVNWVGRGWIPILNMISQFRQGYRYVFIEDKQGDITEDETVRFKSYLLSLGIDDPVTRNAFSSENEYYRNLAHQLVQMLLEPVKEVGGMMSMTDVYCRVNRARGLELLSPEDLMSACQLMEPMKLSLRLRKFDSGATVLQLSDHSEEAVVETTTQYLEDHGSLSAVELSKLVGVSVLLAKERLLTTEKRGSACRDESLEGTRFYPNLFLTRED